MTLEYASGVKAVIGPNVIKPNDDSYIGKKCTIEYYLGSDRNGNYYQVTIDGTNERRPFYTSELDVTPILTKEEKAAKLKKELEKLEKEIAAEAKEKARNDIEGLGAGSFIEIAVDSNTDYIVKVGKNKWHWFSKYGDPVVHHDTTDNVEVIDAVENARKFGYHKIFPASEH